MVHVTDFAPPLTVVKTLLGANFNVHVSTGTFEKDTELPDIFFR